MCFVCIAGALGVRLAFPDSPSGSGTHVHTEAGEPSAPAPFALNPCAMSRGRAGPSKEHYHRCPPPHLQAKENHYRPGPAPFFPRTGPLPQPPFPSYYNSLVHPIGPIQPPAPSLIPSAPNIPSHSKVSPKPEVHNSSQNLSHSSFLGPNSFQCQQGRFLREQSTEAPQFRTSPRGGGGVAGPSRPPISSYHPHSGYSRYSDLNHDHRVRGCLSQDQRFACPPTARPPQRPSGPGYITTKEIQIKYYNQCISRERGLPNDSLCHSFHSLSLHQDRPDRGAGRFDRHSAPSGAVDFNLCRDNITLTPDIQDQVHGALATLKPCESITARLLAKKLRLPKKIVNKVLYSLERSQKASKEGLHPPEWTLYKEPLRREEHRNCLRVSSEHPKKPKDEVVLQTETVEYRVQVEDKDSDTESSSSYCSSLESFVSQSSATHQENRELEHSTMTDQKELLHYLLNSGEVTALVIAKNLGLKSSKQINPTLYALEKKGEVFKNSKNNPPTWELSAHRRERMERSLKATQSTPAGRSQEGASRNEKGGGSIFMSETPTPGLQSLPFEEGWIPEQSHSEAVGIISVFNFVCLVRKEYYKCIDRDRFTRFLLKFKMTYAA